MEWKSPKRYTLKDNYAHKESEWSNFEIFAILTFIYLMGVGVGIAIKIVL
jgi:hypothetical protein